MVLSFIPLKDDQKLPDPLSISANLTTLLNPTCGTKDKTLYVICDMDGKKVHMKVRIKKTAILFVFIFAAIVSVLILLSSLSISGNEDTPRINKNGESKNNDSPLTAVVIGGLIALVSSIGGGTLVFLLQSRHESKVFKRAKLEELTALACQCDDWLDQLILGYLVQGDISATIEKFPINRMRMIQSLYFPVLKNEVEAVSNSVKEFRKMAIMERKNLRETHEYSTNFQEQYEPKQKTVLKAIEDLLKKVSAIQI